jgi:hypothetical protein
MAIAEKGSFVDRVRDSRYIPFNVYFEFQNLSTSAFGLGMGCKCTTASDNSQPCREPQPTYLANTY